MASIDGGAVGERATITFDSGAALMKSISEPINWGGVSVAAWGVIAEGIEIMVVWLAISLKRGMATATIGVLTGICIICLIALVLGKTNIFNKIPTKYLDCIAGTMVTLYGFYFLFAVITGTIVKL